MVSFCVRGERLATFGCRGASAWRAFDGVIGSTSRGNLRRESNGSNNHLPSWRRLELSSLAAFSLTLLCSTTALPFFYLGENIKLANARLLVAVTVAGIASRRDVRVPLGCRLAYVARHTVKTRLGCNQAGEKRPAVADNDRGCSSAGFYLRVYFDVDRLLC